MLETIWFILWGVLWAVYFVQDGYDLGLGTLLPFFAKTEDDRRYIFNAQGPFWDGNEVWLISAGGVTFAAFPTAYAVMFSSLYLALMLLLFALILRGVSFEFRNKIDSPAWRSLWDKVHFVGSFLPALLLGVAFANFFKGLPLNADGINQGNLFTLLNPYGLAGGVLFVLLFMQHGALWLAIKMHRGPLHDRSMGLATRLWPIVTVWIVVFLAMSALMTPLFENYLRNPWLFAILIIPVAGLVLTRFAIGEGREIKAFAGSALTIAGTAFFGLGGMFPNILLSSLNPAWSLTAFNSASSQLTLTIMLTVALIFVPIVIGYQIWVVRLLGHKMTKEDLEYEEAY